MYSIKRLANRLNLSLFLLEQYSNCYERVIQVFHMEQWDYHCLKLSSSKTSSISQKENGKLGKMSLSKLAFWLGGQRLLGGSRRKNSWIIADFQKPSFQHWLICHWNLCSQSLQEAIYVKFFKRALGTHINISSHNLKNSHSSNHNSQIVTEWFPLP